MTGAWWWRVGLLGLVACGSPEGDTPKRWTERGPDTARPTDSGDTGDSAGGGETGDSADPPGDASTGELAATVAIEVPDASLAGVVDVDGDGIDEVLLVASWGQVWVVRVDAHLGSASVGLVDDLDVSYFDAWPVGNGQLVVNEGRFGSSTVTMTAAGAGWSPVQTPLDAEVLWAGAAGDLDGDGVSDALLRIAGDDALWVVRGLLTAPLADRALARIEGWTAARPSGLAESVSSADVDDDGADDLLVLDAPEEALHVLFGPLAAGTAGTLTALAGATLPLGEPPQAGPPAVVDDFDGDGTREVAVGLYDGVALYDGVRPGMTGATPEWVVPATQPVTAGGLRPALLLTDRVEAAFWHRPHSPGAWRPDAAVAGAGVFGRFGGTDPTDVVWLEGGWLFAAPGRLAAPGDDLDRDGALAAADCDDAEPARRPHAPEASNGVDDDCDGLVDEAAAVEPTLVETWLGARNDAYGAELAAWGGLVAVSGQEGAAWLLSPGSGTVAAFSPFSEGVRSMAPGGDMDGDGELELLSVAGGPENNPVSVAFGPPMEGAPLAQISTGIQYGGRFTNVGDLDGDGLAEGATSGQSCASDGSWPTSLALVRSEPSRSLRVERVDDLLGDAVGPADLDGDGYSDLILEQYGTAAFWLGPLDEGALAGRSPSGSFSSASQLRAGDLDGDGASELMTAKEGVVAVTNGPWSSGAWDLGAAADAVVTLGEPVGGVLWVPGAWLFVPLPNADREAGRVLGFSLPLAASLTEDDASLRIVGALPRAHVGAAMATGDLDSDGQIELIVASPGEDAVLDDEGAVRVWRP